MNEGKGGRDGGSTEAATNRKGNKNRNSSNGKTNNNQLFWPAAVAQWAAQWAIRGGLAIRCRNCLFKLLLTLKQKNSFLNANLLILNSENISIVHSNTSNCHTAHSTVPMQHSPQAQVFGVAANGTQFTIHWEFAISVCSTPLCRSPVAPSLSDVATTMAATKAKQRQTAKTNGQKHKQNGGQESSSSAVFVVSAKLLYPGEGKEMGIGREKERGTERSHKFKIARKRRPQSQTPQYAII